MFKFSFQVEPEDQSTATKEEDGAKSESEKSTREPEKDPEADTNELYACEELCIETSLAKSCAVHPDVINNFTPTPECPIEYLNHLALLDETFTDDIVTAESDHSDLVPNRYEGGLKVWECTFDLGQFLAGSEEMKSSFRGKKVLDLGCGAGILGIQALLMGSSVVHFQDYNKDVLTKMTMVNYDLNCRTDTDKRESGTPGCTVKFFSGDWASFTSVCEEKYDLILTSETIYSTENYEKLLELFDRRLEADGIVYLAAKTYYFGVGGGVRLFEKAVDTDGRFEYQAAWNCGSGVKREILKISRKKATS